jgi:beta-galactosidase
MSCGSSPDYTAVCPAAKVDDSNWQAAFNGRGEGRRGGAPQSTQPTVYRASFDAPQPTANDTMTLALRSLGDDESIYLNGQLLVQNPSGGDTGREIILPADGLRAGKNVIAVVATPQGGRRNHGGDHVSQGNPGLIKVTLPEGEWQHSLFSGLAQIIIQSTGQPGEITLTAKAAGLSDGVLKLSAEPAAMRSAIP